MHRSPASRGRIREANGRARKTHRVNVAQPKRGGQRL